jgi:membrane fusion protein, multidrug efflux system
VIPTGAVQRGPTGTFVYVVKDDSTVAMRPIAVQKQDEIQTVVKSGLEADERVVTTGFVRLTEGSKVAVGSANVTPTPAERAPPPRNGQKRQRQQGSNAPPPSVPQ